MLKDIIKKIEYTAFFGTVFPEINRFDDSKYFTIDNLFKYRLSKIKFFLKEKNGKEFILGLQSFYKTINRKEIASEEYRDRTEKEICIKTLEIHQSDYICNFHLKVGDDHITQIRLITKRGKELIVGSDEGEEKLVDDINDNKNYIILFFFGGFRKCLECISAAYIPLNYLIFLSKGYFELKCKLKNKDFKNAVLSKFNKLSISDKVLFKVCCLDNDDLFYSIIKYCLNI